MSNQKNSTINLTRTSAGYSYGNSSYATGSGSGTIGATQAAAAQEEQNAITYMRGEGNNTTVASTKYAAEAPGVPVTYVNQSYKEFADYAMDKIQEMEELADSYTATAEDITANKAARHTHANKTVLDSITSTTLSSLSSRAAASDLNDEILRAKNVEQSIKDEITGKIGTVNTRIDSIGSAKQDKLTAGNNITINGSTISATVPEAYNDAAVRAMIADKQDRLTAGDNITIVGSTISASVSGGSSYDDTEIRSMIAGKQNTLTDDDKQAIAALANVPANLSELTNDCGFITSSGVPTADITANTNARHTHSNKSILDAITQAPITQHQSLANYVLTTDSRLSNARTPVSHTHEGEDITIDINAFDDVIEDLGEDVPSLQFWSEWVNATVPSIGAKAHEHANQSVLDGITSSKVSAWNSMTDSHVNSLIDTKLGVIENGTY